MSGNEKLKKEKKKISMTAAHLTHRMFELYNALILYEDIKNVKCF